MNRTAYIFVPGIYNRPSNPDAATDRAVTWVNTHLPGAVAEKFEYFTTVLTRRLTNRHRSEHLAALIDRYPIAEFSVVLVAHSNGCDLALRALRICQRPANWLHLFAPAVPAAAKDNQLHLLLDAGRIGFLRVHVANNDHILSSRYLGGRPVAWVAKQFADEHHTIVTEHSGGHSDFFSETNFEATMARIAGHEIPGGNQ